ncbi:DUF424 domain-containing protein [Sulfuracidifex tepidarius]|nr:DUF424 family protein [Sulfuracidifex tepidarius]
MKVHLNIIRAQGYVMINVCEEGLLGKRFKENDLVLDINEKFYGGDIVESEYALGLIDEATVMSIVGSTLVDEAIRKGIVHKDGVREISGIKIAQVYNL